MSKEAMKLALEALGQLWLFSDEAAVIANPAITALREALADEALSKMAENARELGLDYEPDIPFGDNNPGLQWDEVPQAFNDWWNAEYDPTGNPFGKDTHAYWAWAGWKAAEQPAQQEPVAWKLVPTEPTEEMLKAMDECSKEGYDERLYAGHAASVYMAAIDAAPEQPAQQEPVEWLTGCPSCGMDSCDCDEGTWNPPAQRTWVGLTGKEVMDVTRKEGHELLDFIYEYGTASEGTEERVVAICKAIEAKLKEKNT